MGPTLEFYALIAAELRRKDLGMWICDDDGDLRGHEVSIFGIDRTSEIMAQREIPQKRTRTDV